MGFFDSLMANPTGSGIYGQTGPRKLSDDIGYVNSLRKRRLDEDYNQAIRMSQIGGSELPNRQPQSRMNAIYGQPHGNAPFFEAGAGNTPSTGLNNPTPGLNTVFREDPDRISPLQAAGLKFKAEDLANDRMKIKQSGRLGEERLGLDKSKYELDVEKNANIYATKQADLQRKSDEAAARLEQAERFYTGREKDAAAQRELSRIRDEARTTQHAADRALDAQKLEELRAQNQRLIEERQKDREQRSSTQSDEVLDTAAGTKKTTTTRGRQPAKPADRGNIRRPLDDK